MYTHDEYLSLFNMNKITAFKFIMNIVQYITNTMNTVNIIIVKIYCFKLLFVLITINPISYYVDEGIHW